MQVSHLFPSILFFNLLLFPVALLSQPGPHEKASLGLAKALQKAGFHLPQTRLKAPHFELFDLQGKRHRLEDYHGKMLLIHFWATWCKPCISELPRLEKLHQHFESQGLLVLAINVDRNRPEQVKRLVQRLKLSLSVLLDPDGKARKAYEVEAFPTSYLVGRDGRFLGKLIGESKWERKFFKEIVK